MDKELNDDIKKDYKPEIPKKMDVSKYQEENFYGELYSDLPKGVVELLMKTHPLMDEKKAEREIEKFETMHSARRSEVEAIKRARLESNNSPELSANTPSQQPPLTQKESNMNKEEIKGNKIVQDKELEDDIIQLVKHKGDGKQDSLKKAQGPKMEEVTIELKQSVPAGKRSNKQPASKKTAPPPSPQRKAMKTQPTSIPKKKTGKDIGKMDMKRMEKDKTLDEFFNSSSLIDEEAIMKIPGGRNTIIIGAAVFICLLGFLVFRTVSLSGKLEKANKEIESLEEIRKQNEDLKLSQLSLEEQLKDLKSGEQPKNNNGDTNTTDTPTDNQTPTENTQKNADGSDMDTYTVVAGDSFWSISQKVYGNGAYYTEILEANGLNESDTLSLGKQLKIPKLS